MKILTCIVCPNSCKLEVEKTGDGYTVIGNLCKRGEAFALRELINPRRTVTTTVKTVFKEQPVIPVKTLGTIEKSRIFELMDALSKVLITTELKPGDVILKDFHDTDVVCSCDMTVKY